MDDVKVQLKIIESQGNIAPTVAHFTNSQNPMKLAGFRANDEKHIRLQNEFKILKRDRQDWKWFYEFKRGTWGTDFSSSADRRPYIVSSSNDGYRTRKFDMTTIAQACLSFLGNSVVASDRPSSISQEDTYYRSSGTNGSSE